MRNFGGGIAGLALGAAFLAVPVPVSGQIVTNPPGILSLWAAEGDPLDSVSTNHGLLQGPVTYAPGRVGQAFAFGADAAGWVEVPYNPGLEVSSEATLMAWVCLDQLPSQRGQFMYIAGRSQSGNDFDLQVELDDCARFYVLGGVNTSTTTPLRTATWYHLTATYRAQDRIEIYLNAVKEGSLAITGAIAANSNPFTIGTSPLWRRPWCGRIDQVRWFNRVLSDVEIAELYVAEFGILPKVPLQLRVSQVELCWETVAGVGYQLQYKSALTTNLWVPLFPDFLRGTGYVWCTNDSVILGQPEKFYRLVLVNETGEP
jgi:hypothetical protein